MSTYAKPMPGIGVDFYHYAPIISDSPEAIIYDTAVRVQGQVGANYAPNSSSNPFYADNGAYINDTSLGSQDVTYTMADIPTDMFYDMIGGTYNGALGLGSSFTAKSRGTLYRRMQAGANRYDTTRPNYRYFRFWSGTFTIPNMDAQTKGESTEYQTQELTYSAVNVASKSLFVQIIDDNNSALADMGITPSMLEKMLVDFNWDPFTGNPAFAPIQRVACAPAIIKASNVDGTPLSTVWLGLTTGEFVDGTIAAADVTAANLPTGITVGAVGRPQENVLQVELTGAATAFTATDNVDDVTFTVAATIIEGGAAALTTDKVSVQFVKP